MTTLRADRARNDERILRAAARLLGEDPGASIQAVADAAGVARLTVYRRYPDRDALVAALRDAVDAELDAELDGQLAGHAGWTGGSAPLVDLVHALARVASRYPVALLRYAPVPGRAPAADARIVAVLRAGQRAGALRGDVSAETLNTALFGVLSSLLAADPDATGAAETVLALLLPGMLPAPPSS